MNILKTSPTCDVDDVRRRQQQPRRQSPTYNAQRQLQLRQRPCCLCYLQTMNNARQTRSRVDLNYEPKKTAMEANRSRTLNLKPVNLWLTASQPTDSRHTCVLTTPAEHDIATIDLNDCWFTFTKIAKIYLSM